MKQSVLRISVHRLPKILCGGCCFAAQNVFTGESKPAVSHKDSSGSHCHNALMPAHAEDNMPVRIHGTQRRVRDIIHNDYIRSRTFLNPSDRDPERAGCNLGVPVKKNACNFRKPGVRQACGVSQFTQRHFCNFKHIGCIGVGTDAESNALFKYFEHGAASRAVKKIRFGTVYNAASASADNIKPDIIHICAVCKQRIGCEHTGVLQSLNRAAAVFLRGIIKIIRAFGNTDVKTRASFVTYNAFAKRCIRQRKG